MFYSPRARIAFPLQGEADCLSRSRDFLAGEPTLHGKCMGVEDEGEWVGVNIDEISLEVLKQFRKDLIARIERLQSEGKEDEAASCASELSEINRELESRGEKAH